MLSILKTKDKNYVILAKNIEEHFVNEDQLINSMNNVFNIPFPEIEAGLVEMIRNDDNYANYGINGNFIFTKKV